MIKSKVEPGTKKKYRGVFCIEGYWHNDLTDLSTVKPILDLLERREGVSYIHHDAAVKEELLFLAKRWAQKKYRRYPILYLSMHGTLLGLMPYIGNTVTLDELASVMEGKCKNRIILIGSCLIFKSSKKKLDNFMKKTGALVVCGYQCIVDWTPSTAFELLLIHALQNHNFDNRNRRFIVQHMMNLAKRFPELQFKLLTQGGTSCQQVK